MGLKIGFFYMDLTYFLGYAKAHMDHPVGSPMAKFHPVDEHYNILRSTYYTVIIPWVARSAMDYYPQLAYDERLSISEVRFFFQVWSS